MTNFYDHTPLSFDFFAPLIQKCKHFPHLLKSGQISFLTLRNRVWWKWHGMFCIPGLRSLWRIFLCSLGMLPLCHQKGSKSRLTGGWETTWRRSQAPNLIASTDSQTYEQVHFRPFSTADALVQCSHVNEPRQNQQRDYPVWPQNWEK